MIFFKKTNYLTSLVITTVLICSLIGCGKSDDAIKILFVGNSLTNSNNLPQMISELADSKGHEIDFEAHVSGGARLLNHADDQALIEKIQKEKWDYVVLQGHSLLPGFPEEHLKEYFYPYAKKLIKTIKEANAETKVLLYMAMTRKYGDTGNKNFKEEERDYPSTQKRVNNTYIKVAKTHKTMIAPVGVAWSEIRKNYPEIELYSDNVHPNLLGSYLAACVFVGVLFEKECNGSEAPGDLHYPTARKIQHISDKTVIETKGKWDFTR